MNVIGRWKLELDHDDKSFYCPIQMELDVL